MRMAGREVLSRAFFHLAGRTCDRVNTDITEIRRIGFLDPKASLGRRDKAKRSKKIYLRIE
jgi:hypothetical protein